MIDFDDLLDVDADAMDEEAAEAHLARLEAALAALDASPAEDEEDEELRAEIEDLIFYIRSLHR